MSIAQTRKNGKSKRDRKSEAGETKTLAEVAAEIEPFARNAAKEGKSMREFERGLLDMLLRAGYLAMNLFLEHQGDGDQGPTVTAEDGRTLYRSEDPAERQLRTIFGPHQFQAYVYRTGQHPNTPIAVRPIDNRLGIEPDRWSPLLQEFAMLFSVEQAFNPAAKAFEHLFRHALSVDTMEQVSRRMGVQAGEFLETLAAPPAKEEGEILVLTSDGKGIPMVKSDAARLSAFEDKPQRPGNRRMATVSSVYSVDPHIRTADSIVAALFRDKREEAPKEDRPKPCHKRVMAHLPQVVEETGDAKPVSGITVGLSWATCEVQSRHRKDQPLVRIMDGQPSLWETLEHCNADVAAEQTVDILDILHVSSYVWRAAKIFHRHKEHQEAFARDRLQRILEGDVRRVITGLRRMATQHKLEGDPLKEINTVCGYFASHIERMKYHEYLAAGYPIASGVIEGACRHLVKDRMERTGVSGRLKPATERRFKTSHYES